IAASLILFASQARGQQPVHRIGVLANTQDPEMTQAFVEGLRERGYVVGQNVQIEYRSINPTNPMHRREQAKLPEFGRLLGVELVIVEASTPDQFETAFDAARKQGAEAIHVLGDPLIFIHSAKVAGLAARYQLPAIYLIRRNVLDGGLMSYGPNTV